jgi:hypothetical protein
MSKNSCTVDMPYYKVPNVTLGRVFETGCCCCDEYTYLDVNTGIIGNDDDGGLLIGDDCTPHKLSHGAG